MSGWLRRRAALLAGAAVLVATVPALPAPDFEPAQLRRILQHGPWPPPAARDPSNRVSGDPRAVALGHRLFFDPRLSANGAIACVTCHVPERGWIDGRPRAMGLAPLDRNTPTVLDAVLHRWFAWDGRSDSLWAQGLRALLDPREMGAGARHVASVVGADPILTCLYGRAFGAGPGAGAGDERVLVDTAKALAAFVETIRSGRTAFDEFRDALARGDTGASGRYPLAARRGLRTFVGQGNCSLCHFGPHFTNGEFHDVGVPFLAAPGRVDAGRHEGIKRLRADRFNLLGPWSDDPTGTAAVKTRHVEPQHANFGQFKTPSLRNVALTAPYMHDGRFATLRDVIRHYSRLDMERLHTHGEQLLRPLGLSEAEMDDLVAFLETLTDPRATAGPPPPAALGSCASPGSP
ncbi:MAG TPA: cytochrome c peroxidase [Methylomirabilota bacterium]|nr:cytochrome c peroxidase [Methylomirabilota bacterium]